MGSIYQLIFFFAIALLAIVITVFVLAVSLLGRAVRLSTEEQAKAEKERKEENERRIEKIQRELDKAKKQGKKPDIESLTKSLEELEEQDSKHARRLRWIRWKPKLLTATWGVLIPGAFFLISVIFSSLALYLQDDAFTTSLYMWIAVITLCIGICFIGLTLKVIEGVAITSEETVFVRQKEMFKAALLELEEAKRPELSLEFRKIKFPLHVKADSEVQLSLVLRLHKGDFAEDVRIFVGAPQGFIFPKQDIIVLSEDHDYPNYICSVWKVATLIRGLQSEKTIIMKSPPTVGSFTMIYYIFCKGFAGTTPTELEVIVE